MNTVVLTIVAAILIMIGVAILLGIGWLLTGKSRLKRGTCGSLPCDKEKTTNCMICGAKKIVEQEEEKKDDNNTQ